MSSESKDLIMRDASHETEIDTNSQDAETESQDTEVDAAERKALLEQGSKSLLQSGRNGDIMLPPNIRVIWKGCAQPLRELLRGDVDEDDRKLITQANEKIEEMRKDKPKGSEKWLISTQRYELVGQQIKTLTQRFQESKKKKNKEEMLKSAKKLYALKETEGTTLKWLGMELTDLMYPKDVKRLGEIFEIIPQETKNAIRDGIDPKNSPGDKPGEKLNKDANVASSDLSKTKAKTRANPLVSKVPKMSAGKTEFGQIEAVVRAGAGKIGGYRGIVNAGTELHPFYDCLSGSNFGTGQGKEMYEHYQAQQSPSEKLKRLRLQHIEALHGYVAVKPSGLRSTNPIAYVCVQFTKDAVQEFGLAAEKEWVTRSQAKTWFGDTSLTSQLGKLERKWKSNLLRVMSCVRAGIHPDYDAKKLTEADFEEMPWLERYLTDFRTRGNAFSGVQMYEIRDAKLTLEYRLKQAVLDAVNHNDFNSAGRRWTQVKQMLVQEMEEYGVPAVGLLEQQSAQAFIEEKDVSDSDDSDDEDIMRRGRRKQAARIQDKTRSRITYKENNEDEVPKNNEKEIVDKHTQNEEKVNQAIEGLMSQFQKWKANDTN